MKNDTLISVLKKIQKDISAMRTALDLLVASDAFIKSINEHTQKEIKSFIQNLLASRAELIRGKKFKEEACGEDCTTMSSCRHSYFNEALIIAAQVVLSDDEVK